MMWKLAPGKTWPLLALVAVVQIGILANIVMARQSLINNGREIVLPVIPVDPRDLFRGDYVILNYDVSRLNLAKVAVGQGFADVRKGAVVYVTLVPDTDGKWSATAISTVWPNATVDKENTQHAVLKGRVRHRTRPKTERGQIHISYGIESYFVPEGTGLALEKKVRSSTVSAVVALGDDGTAALKGLKIDDERVLFDSLF